MSLAVKEPVVPGSVKDARLRALGSFGQDDSNCYYDPFWMTTVLSDGLKQFYLNTDGVQDHYTSKSQTGYRYIDLPPLFMRARVLLFEGRPLREAQLVLSDFTPDVSNGSPIWFAIHGWPNPRVILGPNPPIDDLGVIELFYYRAPRALTSDNQLVEIPDSFFGYIADYLRAHLALNDRRYGEGDKYMEKYNAGRAEFQRFMTDPAGPNAMEQLDDTGYMR